MARLPPAHSPCACGSGLPYAQCCGHWHTGLGEGLHAPTPETLMRSRYCAYVHGQLDYLLATWHASTAPGDLALWPVQWLGLEVRGSEQSAEAGVVEFVARYREHGRGHRLHEISRFVRENGRWYYVDGLFPNSPD